jgi:hypothetical protein
VGIHSGASADDVPYFADLLYPVEFVEPLSVHVIAIRRGADDNSRGFKPRLFAPLKLLTLFSFFLTVGLLVSFASSATSAASHWTTAFYRRKASRYTPDGDVLIYCKVGSFIVVRCDESIAAQIYFGPQTCRYRFSGIIFSAWSPLALYC